jgi:hypothetical protein
MRVTVSEFATNLTVRFCFIGIASSMFLLMIIALSFLPRQAFAIYPTLTHTKHFDLPVFDLNSSLLNLCLSSRPPRFDLPLLHLLSLFQSSFDCVVFNTLAIVSLKLLVICSIGLAQSSFDSCLLQL